MDEFDLRKWSEFEVAGGSMEAPALVDQIVIDSRRIDSIHSVFIALPGTKVDGHQFICQAEAAGAKYAIVSQSFNNLLNFSKIILLRVPDPLRALQSIAKCYRSHLKTQIIAITGSFGKTMVKDLLFSLLKTTFSTSASPESFNSQIGVALSLLSIRTEDDFAIIEAAISNPGEMDYLADMISPDYSILTPLGKKHLATLEDLPTLSKEILKLLNATKESGWILLPKEYQEENLISDTKKCYYWNEPDFSLPHAHLGGISTLSYLINFPDGTTYQEQTPIKQAYFIRLINMAIKAAWLIGVTCESIKKVLSHYQPEATRTEIWKSHQGATVINDIYCSDPQSIDRALKYFHFSSEDPRKFFIFGGMKSDSPRSHTDYRWIGKSIAQASVKHLFLVGPQSFHPLTDEVLLHSPETEILAFNNYTEAFDYLIPHLHQKDILIFKGEKKLPLEMIIHQFNDSLSNNQCTINLAAIQSNIELIRKKLTADTRLMVMVKALAYGTDDVRMAKFLATCEINILGVSYVDEAIALKKEGVTQTIFSINAAPYEAVKVVKWDLEVGVNDQSMIDALGLEAEKQQKKIKVHLHINTGMSRFGCRPEEAVELAKCIVAHPFLELEGIMTHFACADDFKEDAFTEQQIHCFDQVIQELAENDIHPKWKHAANSSAALRFSLPQYNMVRIGLALYGLYASEAVRDHLDLKLALTLTSKIVAINHCKKGESISYGRRYKVTRDNQKIAVLPIGYFDGFHRNYSEKAHVLIHGQSAPMVGNICMDYMMVDVTDIPSVSIGDDVLIFGEDDYGFYLSPEELATSGDSIIHELMTCLGPRISRIFVYEEGKQLR
ncbi:MAG: bifunctional UDP-N-acetylmuramoyl-tripeptide:D-alanyl-D-alanine ligase/alanine racemase [Parachlamydiaceae bacterium]|nr:bifunctional UDP-N-acetylmuramoyl-tripeptide:D-alanyl-D-alanine ligase/alanine racemase [Parachlamydiaceae bacterium]